MLKDELKRLGLSKNEAIVYSALAGMGQSKAGKVIEKTGIHRNLVYQALESLHDRNLVSKSTVGKVAAFQIADPSRLLDIVYEQEVTAKRVIENLAKVRSVAEQEIEVFEGVRAARNFWISDVKQMGPSEELRIIGSGGKKFQDLMGEMFEPYMEEFKRHGKARILMHPEQQYDEYGQRVVAGENIEIKMMDTSALPAATIGFTDTHVSFQLYSANPVVIRIGNSDLVDLYKSYFEVLWNQNSVTYRGERGVRLFMEDTLDAEDIYFIGGNGGIERFHPDIWDWYKHERLKREIGWHDLIDPGGGLSGAKTPGGFYDEPGTEFKVLPSSVASPHVTCVYGNKVANIVWGEDTFINVIEDRDVAESHKKYFHYLWNQDVVTRSGKEGYEEAFGDILSSLNQGDELLVLGISLFDKEFADFILDFHAKRAEKGVKARIMINKIASDVGNRLGRLSNTDVRYMPEGLVTPSVFLVYGDKVLISVPEQRTFITIENEKTAEALRAQFEAQWK